MINPINRNDLPPLEIFVKSKAYDESIKKEVAACEFEAIFLRHILSEAQKPIFKTKFIPNTTADQIYRDLFVYQLAEAMSKAGSLGIASMITKYLEWSSKHKTTNLGDERVIRQNS